MQNNWQNGLIVIIYNSYFKTMNETKIKTHEKSR